LDVGADELLAHGSRPDVLDVYAIDFRPHRLR
jgi:hypothetical protein